MASLDIIPETVLRTKIAQTALTRGAIDQIAIKIIATDARNPTTGETITDLTGITAHTTERMETIEIAINDTDNIKIATTL